MPPPIAMYTIRSTTTRTTDRDFPNLRAKVWAACDFVQFER